MYPFKEASAISLEYEGGIGLGISRVAMHLNEVMPQVILTSGNSADFTGFALNKYWVRMYPGKDLPRICNLGPEGNLILYGYPLEQYIQDEEREGMILDYLTANQPWLLQEKEKNIVYLDDHSKSGHKIGEIQRNMYRSGFKFLSTAVYCSRADITLPAQTFVGMKDNSLAEKLFEYGRFLEMH